jgi:hypothetical protein
MKTPMNKIVKLKPCYFRDWKKFNGDFKREETPWPKIPEVINWEKQKNENQSNPHD